MTDDQLAAVKDLAARNWKVNRIAAALSLSKYEVRKVTDPEAWERSQQIHRERRSRELPHRKIAKVTAAAYKPSPELVRRLLLEIPPDTRDVTGVFCGDPLPQRSALFKKQMGLA